MVVTIDDILDQLWSENTRLLKELVFANKCLNILDDLKSELNLIYKKFETQLNSENKFNQLRDQLNYICSERHDKDFAEINRKTCYISDTNDAKDYINDTKVVDKSDSEHIQEVVDNNQVIDNHKDVTVVQRLTDTVISSSSSSSSSDQQSGKLLPTMKPQQSMTDNRIHIKPRFLIIRPNNVGHKVNICQSMEKIEKKKLILDKNSGKYKCHYEGCDKTFWGRGSLRYHKRLHHERDTTKTLNCQYTDCQFQCLQEYQMKIHLNCKHSDVKTIVCSNSGCYKTFKTLRSLRIHSLIHTKTVHKCDVDGCQRNFRYKTNLTKHMAEHRRSEPTL
ncbi:zinc finger protein GLI2-like [Oppia nitens]|uniref:zinc finger protein GLI2-like n=1 Tax=Oppia nitens TaxID=1686743 RepID=UPI0023DBFCF0|nr:zinc finger protein GLI2-like [Oppia nitens]